MCDNFAFLYPRTGKNVVKKASHGMNIFSTFKFVGLRSSIKRLFFCFCFLGWKSVTIIKPSVWFYTNSTLLPSSFDIEVLPLLRHSFVAKIIIYFIVYISSIYHDIHMIWILIFWQACINDISFNDDGG